ncbi:SDR family NAD(P)-dependent oxidoreductase [Legionella dresdenensis]|uniref:SDR family NAD(P)-dependent oxidoreductase n=1 Tax=Legionella dresdenensis TaxID=450200 RepID=A0ABV8CBS6_9GAMM
MDFMGRVAVITGAASGIGLALSKRCLELGINVVMADHAVTDLCDQVEILSAEYDVEVLGVVTDVSRPDSVKQLTKQTIERFNRIDWLFNNAGISGHLAPLWELTSEHIHKVMEINLYGAIYCIQSFLPFMFKQTHHSHIINISSFYGLCSGSMMSAYSMSKHALVALSESLYFDLRRLEKPVNVSVVCPSFVNTNLLANSTPLHNSSLHSMLSELIGRSRPAEDVASHIIAEVEKNNFYILPDKEVKDYCASRSQAIVEQTEPHQHSLEKIVASLSRRASVTDCA